MRFRPKDVLKQARELEEQAKNKEAAVLFAQLGRYFRKKGNLKEALTLLDHALRLCPSAYRIELEKVLCFNTQGDTESAENCVRRYTEAVLKKGHPEDADAFLESQLELLPRLRAFYFQSILSVDRTSSKGFLKWAKAEMDSENFQAARAALLGALEAEKPSEEVLTQIEEVWRRSGGQGKDVVGYVDSYRKGKLGVPDLIRILSEQRTNQAEPNRSSVKQLESAGSDPRDLQALIRELESEMGLRPKGVQDTVEPLVKEFRRRTSDVLRGDFKTKLDLALGFAEMGLVQEALEELKQIPSTASEFSEAAYWLGEILLKEGSDMAALDQWQSVLRLEGLREETHKATLYGLICVNLKLHDQRQAAHYIRVLEKIDPNYRDLKAIKRNLHEKAA